MEKRLEKSTRPRLSPCPLPRHPSSSSENLFSFLRHVPSYAPTRTAEHRKTVSQIEKEFHAGKVETVFEMVP
jgi:hypothetical protein